MLMINCCPELQGSQGDTGLQGPQGPPGIGVAGIPVWLSRMYMHAHAAALVRRQTMFYTSFAPPPQGRDGPQGLPGPPGNEGRRVSRLLSPLFKLNAPERVSRLVFSCMHVEPKKEGGKKKEEDRKVVKEIAAAALSCPRARVFCRLRGVLITPRASRGVCP